MSDTLLIIGASVRAAAFSALRAGLTPRCADLFADVDLAQRCDAQRIPFADYPQGFHAIVADHPGPWLYTGALENHRLLIAELARLRPLWGNTEEALNPCRLPDLWTQVLQDAGVPCPRLRWQREDVPADVSWLVKPVKSAGGVGIRHWRGEPLRPFTFLQEYIDGESCAAIYLGWQRQARLLGVTRQLVGADWLHAGAFRYCGSIGPLPLTDEAHMHFERLGQALVKGCGVRGLFGVDCVLADGVPWPVEINPRYTASIEVLEHATQLPLLALQRAVFGSDRSIDNAHGTRVADAPGAPRSVGKAILFAQRDLTFPAAGPWLSALHCDPWTMPAFADIPAAGTPIRQGQPILTLLTRADHAAHCEGNLRQLARQVDHILFG